MSTAKILFDNATYKNIDINVTQQFFVHDFNITENYFDVTGK